MTSDPLGLLLVDKPGGVTSHDVVGRVRAILGTRRVGHAGTLDPMATGLLVIAIGRATKLLGHLALETKSYTATIRLGAATDTDDADGQIISHADASQVTIEQMTATMAELTGDIHQVPSSFSAIKVGGRRAYDLARSGQLVRLAARPVTVSSFRLAAAPIHDATAVDLQVAVDCSSGTYIRALARDLGAALGVGGHLTTLRRTAIGPFTVANAVDVFPHGTTPRGEPRPPIDEALRQTVRGSVINVNEAARTAFPARAVTAAEAADLRYGRALPAAGIGGVHAAFDAYGNLLALLQEDGGQSRVILGWAAT